MADICLNQCLLLSLYAEQVIQNLNISFQACIIAFATFKLIMHFCIGNVNKISLQSQNVPKLTHLCPLYYIMLPSKGRTLLCNVILNFL